jgi:hypothetical protein
MSDSKPVRCQKCGKPLGYVTVLAKGLLRFQQPLQNVKVVAICMECFQKNSARARLRKTGKYFCLDFLTCFSIGNEGFAEALNGLKGE